MPRRTRILLPVFAALCACSRSPETRTLTVAAASDLNFALPEISRAFEREHPGVRVRASFGSSGNIYSQIANGAPYDIFLSADVDYPRRLTKAGAGVRDSLFIYGAGRLALWVPDGSRLDPATALRGGDIRRLAIANPQHAPYGRAAEAALRSLGVYEALEKKLVFGENVSQAMEFAASGAADAGLIPLSLAAAPHAGGRYWEVPRSAYPRLEQAGLIIRDSADARALRSFLLSNAGRAILKRSGFLLPEER
jgi:molybdate transport system substrate-binding protein